MPVSNSTRKVSLDKGVLSCGETPAGVRLPIMVGGIKRVTASFARPADTTTYAAGDVVGPATTPAVLTFSDVARVNGGVGTIRNAQLSITGTTATNGTFRLYLYDTSITPIADNAAFTQLIGDTANLIGRLDFTVNTEGSGSTALTAQSTTAIPFVAASGVTAIYGVLVAQAAFAPSSAAVVRVNLTVEQA